MVEEATVDAYGESEQTTGWFTMMDEHLDVPFETKVLGARATVERVERGGRCRTPARPPTAAADLTESRGVPPRSSLRRGSAPPQSALRRCAPTCRDLGALATAPDPPFDTTLLDRHDQIVAICRRGRERQSIPILDLPLPAPLPAGAEWIEAYRRWRGQE